jgi:hypothetical protein
LSSSGFGGLFGLALGLYVIHEVLHDGRTGRRLGYVRARSKSHAKQLIQKKVDGGRYPPHVRVLYGKDIPSHKNKTRSSTHSNSLSKSFHITVPRIF